MLAYLQSFYHLFFPNTCLLCNKSLFQHEKQICSVCKNNIPRSYFHLKEENPAVISLWGRAEIKRAVCFMLYQKGNIAQDLLHLLKYKNQKEIGEHLASLYSQELTEVSFFDGIDYIIPVPLHPKKLQKRGYNQSYCISKGIRNITHIPILENALIKTENTTSQTTKGRYGRSVSANNIYVLNDIFDLENKHVLLVDDVMTTGATIESCYQALSVIPTMEVSVLTLAYAC